MGALLGHLVSQEHGAVWAEDPLEEGLDAVEQSVFPNIDGAGVIGVVLGIRDSVQLRLAGVVGQLPAGLAEDALVARGVVDVVAKDVGAASRGVPVRSGHPGALSTGGDLLDFLPHLQGDLRFPRGVDIELAGLWSCWKDVHRATS